MQYYGTRLSENISRREPEGYLLCLNVPVARTGTQDYLPEELNLQLPCHPELVACGARGGDPAHGARANPCSEGSSMAGMISVFRPEEEVFSPETIASFEGMPVTNDHPPDGVDVENIRRLQRGHAHNVRRGTGNESDLLLADLIITDPVLIDAILGGKREISCGYTYELCEEGGRYIQRKIRGNHIAVVDAGRAGPRVSIKDEQASRFRICHPERSEGSSSLVSHTTHSERRNTTMKKSLSKVLARMAKDGDTETVAEIIEEMIAEKPEEAAAEEPVTVEVPENHEITIDEEAFSGLLQRLDQLIALLTAGLASAEPAVEDADPEEAAEAVEEILEAAAEAETQVPAEEIAEIMESVLEPEASVTLEEGAGDDCGDPDPDSANDALRAALMTIRPVLKRMSPGERRKACADMAARLRRVRRAGDGRIYSALAAARKPAAAANLAGLGKRIMAARNVNYIK